MLYYDNYDCHENNFAADILYCQSICFQSATLKPYLTAVRHTLSAALCVENFDSQIVERHNKPEVEIKLAIFHCLAYFNLRSFRVCEYTYVVLFLLITKGVNNKCCRSSKELLLVPVVISRNEREKVLIEGSVNSLRISIAIKQVFKILECRFQ